MDKISTWIITMVTIGGMTLGAALTVAYLTNTGKIKINVSSNTDKN